MQHPLQCLQMLGLQMLTERTYRTYRKNLQKKLAEAWSLDELGVFLLEVLSGSWEAAHELLQTFPLIRLKPKPSSYTAF